MSQRPTPSAPRESWPIHPVLFALTPVAALAATNATQIPMSVIWRPFVWAAVASLALLGLGTWVYRDHRRGAWAATWTILLFASYGHVYDLLKSQEVFGILVGRHRILVPLFTALLTSGLLLWRRRPQSLRPLTLFANTASLVGLLIPLFQIGLHLRQESSGQDTAQAFTESESGLAPLVASESVGLPDVYYIILDLYTRGDALRRDLGFDNGAFLGQLSDVGFYVTACSRSNYQFTQASLTSSLNVNYLDVLGRELARRGLPPDQIWSLLKHGVVRAQFERLGYTTVAFETGYEWSRMADIDIYLGRANDSLLLQGLSPFEVLLMKSTALRLWTDYQTSRENAPVVGSGFPHHDHVNRQLFILEQIPHLADLEEPTFTFVHMLVPHPPYVFGPGGELRTDPGFYSGDLDGPLNEDYLRQGYLGQIEFINGEILRVILSLLENSPQPPIIILQGDHGLRGENRSEILNAYFFPGGGGEALYPAISPVNSFRVLFNEYFSGHYELLPDVSYDSEGVPLSPRSSPDCPK